MDWLGAAGLGTAVLALAVCIIGLVVVVMRNSDRQGLVRGLQLVYSGMAGVCVGLVLFVGSRPEDVLPLSFKLASVVLLLAVGARVAARVVTLGRRSNPS